MDETDLRLCQMLLLNSRTPYRDLSDALKISVQAVHRRVQNLVDEGCIHRWVTHPSERVLPRLSVQIYGRSGTRNLDETTRLLGEHELTMGVYIASGNMMYAAGLIRSINELSGYTDFVSRTAGIEDPVVGIIPSMTGYGSFIRNEPGERAELKPVEWRIIGALVAEPRKPVSEIARQLRVSTRIVNRHLARLVEEELVTLTFEWYPKPMGDQIVFVHLMFNTDVELNPVISDYMRRYSPRICFCIPFVNVPRHLLVVTWSRSMLEFEELQRQLENEPLVEGTEAHFMYRGGYFETWVDRELREVVDSLDG